MREKINGPFQCVHTFGVTPRATMQARQVMAQLSIVAFDRIGLGLVQDRMILSAMVVDISIQRQSVTEVMGCPRRLIHHLLEFLPSAVLHNQPADKTTRGAIHGCNDVNFVFLLWT